MARPRTKLDIPGQAAAVAERLRRKKNDPMRERLLAVSHGLKGEKSLDEIAEHVGRSRATIQTWFDLYRSGGIDRLCSTSGAKRGPDGKLTPAAREGLRKKLAKGSFRNSGQARSWLSRKHGIEAAESSVRRWLGKLGARLKVVRPRHPNSCDLKRFKFRNQLARQLFGILRASGKKFRGRPLRLWISDEARFGLQPSHRRAWVKRGVRAHKDSRCRYDWQYVWAALQIGGGGSEFLYTNKADGDISAAFLKQIGERDKAAIHVVIWDGAGFHPDNDNKRIPDNVVVIKQPPYSPELNPVERLWDMLRDGLCNRVWRDLDKLMAHATLWLESFWNDPKRILSLVGSNSLLRQANA